MPMGRPILIWAGPILIWAGTASSTSCDRAVERSRALGVSALASKGACESRVGGHVGVTHVGGRPRAGRVVWGSRA
eukprot:2705028-Prymnesium_polylepis.1